MRPPPPAPLAPMALPGAVLLPRHPRHTLLEDQTLIKRLTWGKRLGKWSATQWATLKLMTTRHSAVWSGDYYGGRQSVWWVMCVCVVVLMLQYYRPFVVLSGDYYGGRQRVWWALCGGFDAMVLSYVLAVMMFSNYDATFNWCSGYYIHLVILSFDVLLWMIE